MTDKLIPRALSGERLLDVYPAMTPFGRDEWHRRMNLFTGRALSAAALGAEQVARAGHLALRGQILSPGVIDGLELALEPPDEAGARHLYLSPGRGITAGGEDLALLAPRRIGLADVPVASGAELGQVAVLLLQPITLSADERAAADPCGPDADSFGYEDWYLADGCRLLLYPWPADLPPHPAPGPAWRNRLAAMIFDIERRRGPGDPMPWARAGLPIGLIAFASPGAPAFLDRFSVVRTGGRPRLRAPLLPDAGSPTLWQARILQFADQLVEGDGAGEFRSLPPCGLLPADAVDARAGLSRFFPASYTVEAVPIPEEQLALAMRESASLRPFDTGIPDQVRVLVPVPQEWFEPRLLVIERPDPAFARVIARFSARRARWLARRDDLRARRSVLQAALAGGPPAPLRPEREPDEPPGPGPATLTGGPLPARVPANAVLQLNVDGVPHSVTFTAESVEQLDLVTAEEIDELLRAEGVPVRAITAPDSDRLQLLTVAVGAEVTLEVPSPADSTAPDNSAHGALGLGAGEVARGSADATDPIDADDPLLRAPEEGYGVEIRDGELAATPLNALRETLGRTPIRQRASVALAANDFAGVQIPALRSKLSYDAEGGQLRFAGVMSRPERAALLRLSSAPAFRSAVDSLRDQSQTVDIGQLDRIGLTGFVSYLQAKIDRADDTVDLGFLRVQTDIFRLRQNILGDTAATRLATSPILADIAKSQSAVATTENLRDYLEQSKGKTVQIAQREDLPTPVPERARPLILGGDRSGTASIASLSSSVFASGLASTRPISKPALGLSGIALAGSDRASIPPQIAASPISGISIANDRAKIVKDLGGVLFGPPQRTQPAVIEDSPIVGKPNDFRTATVAARLEKSPSLEAKDFSVASKYAVFSSVAALDIEIDDLSMPGLGDEGAHTTFGMIKAGGRIGQILDRAFDPDPENGDEAAFFAQTVKTLEGTVASMRIVEGRVQAYRRALEQAKETLQTIRELIMAIDARLAVIDGEVGEARHDVAVARALLVEEEGRIDAINKRRDAIIGEHVRFLAFQRARSVDYILSVPARPIAPAMADQPVPDCPESVAPPAEIRALIDLLREVPVDWLPNLRPALDRLDRLDLLIGTLQSAQVRAVTRPAVFQSAVASGLSAGRFGSALGGVLQARQLQMSQQRAEVASFNIQQLAGASWQLARDTLRRVISPGDLADADHGRADVSRQVAEELDRIGRVAACLYQSFSAALPIIRLGWAERISQFDAPIRLRSLDILPRWGEIPADERRSTQGMVSWLYSRVAADEPAALSLIDDLVRVCILLASHAPVSRIISGKVLRPTTLRPGIRVDVAVDIAQVRVGMPMLLYAGSAAVARATVEDIGAGAVAARVIELSDHSVESVRIEKDAGAQLMPMTLAGGRARF